MTERATTKRSITERAMTDIEAQRARREGRAVRPRPHDPTSAMRTAACIIAHARHVEADAMLIASHAPDVAHALDKAGTGLRAGTLDTADGVSSPAEGRAFPTNGQSLPAEGYPFAMGRHLLPTNKHPFELTSGAVARHSRRIAMRRDRIRSDARYLKAELATIRDPAARASLEREAAKIAASWAKLVPDDEHLQRWASRGDGASFNYSPADMQADRSPPEPFKDADPPNVEPSHTPSTPRTPTQVARETQAERNERSSRSNDRRRDGWDL